MSETENKHRPDRGGFDPTATVVIPSPAATQAALVPDDLGQIQVEVVGGPMDGLGGASNADSLVIGRASESALTLALDPMVSGRHCRIQREGRHYWLEDLGSRNGTWLGDHPLRQRTLIGPGTTFTVGRTQIEFLPR